MNLKEFVQVTQQEIDDFEAFWEERSEEDPDNYPRELEDTEWFEHFVSWRSSD